MNLAVMKNVLKKAVSIEMIFIYTALVIFFCTIYFKSASNIQMQELDSDMLVLQMNISNPDEKISPQEKVLKIQDDYEPYAYFDSELKKGLDEICNDLIEEKRNSQAVIDFQNLMHKTQDRLNLGYDSLLYSSIFLLAIAVFMIMEKSFKKSIRVEQLTAVQNEKASFSRDLHDGVAQNLAALKIYLEKEDIAKSKFYAKQALNEIRYMIGSGSIDFSESFERMITDICLAFESNFCIKVKTYFASSKIEMLDKEKKVHLVRILQEALSNIARHSDASLVEIKLIDGIDDFRFIISDNGKGFKMQEVERKKQNGNQKHYGLTNIKKRAELIGAKADFITCGGSTIAVTIKDFVR